MSGAASPPVLLEPIANSAASGASPGDKTNPLPDAPTGTNAASVQGGFPAITMESELAGGLPPLGQDMNGFLFLLSSHTMYVECGQLYQYSSTLATEIGGYKVGTILGMSDGSGVWLCTADANTSNPDTGGAGWVPLAAYGVTSVPVTGGTVNLTAAQSRYPVIALTGTLTSNLTLNFPNRIGTWLIANGTSGAFTTTVKASGSAGVTIPQGGFASPTGVYCVADGNIYPTVSPLSVPIDQAPNPLTLAERTNNGYLLANYFQQFSGPENPTIGNVFVEDFPADNYLRKIPLALFAQQMIPDTVNGNGICINLPGGYKLQMGSCNPNGGSAAVTFPVPFTTAVYPVPSSMAGGPVQTWIPTGTLTLSGMRVANTGGSSFWIAVGN